MSKGKEWTKGILTNELHDFKAVDSFADKVRDFVGAGLNLGRHEFKFN